jgi:hypothetical protein
MPLGPPRLIPPPFTDAIDKLSQDYRDVFRGEVGQRVLEDLARFTRANESTFHPDARVSAQLDGRREVWLRIQKQLQLTPEQILELRFPTRNREVIDVG